jgi:hypothetical protein
LKAVLEYEKGMKWASSVNDGRHEFLMKDQFKLLEDLKKHTKKA